MLTHANLTINVGQVRAWQNRQVTESDRMLGILPLFHVFAMTTVMNFSIASGMEMIHLPKFELVPTLKLIGKLRPTMMPGVPTLFNAMLRHPHIRDFDLSSLEYCISGGAALPIEVKRSFEAISGCGVVEGYGLSETSPVVSCNPVKAVREGSIGLPLPATEISIRSLEDPTREMPRGEPGELCIAGPQVMTGYWNKPQETEGSFVGRYFRTGDIGYMDEDGYVFIVDRIKDMIIASGFKIYPRNVEEAIYTHPSVKECAVIGIGDPYRGQTVKAVIALKDGEALSIEELGRFLTDKLSPIEMPKIVEFRAELPKTAVGKIQKKVLIEEERARAALQTETQS
ncbi:MAG: AMP-binding protein, partial [Dongiaceae bacterium]